mmetsp:Transcript_3032/g.4540  ORF Transcript_3032/g.4540 Transcript_3032/m.4540 type:complete len:541 (-) Transcript_3032:64-1686(-)
MTEMQWDGHPRTACFIFPEASGHINSSLALSERLAKKGWKVHYLSALVMKECIENTGATFDDERVAAPELCEGGLGYFAAYERLKEEICPGAKAWEGRAHTENLFLLMKLPGTIEWLKSKKPSVVVYCPIWNRIGQVSARVLGIPHVGIVTIAGFGGFHTILASFLEPEGATFDDFKRLYHSSESNQAAIDSLCSEPYNLDCSLFEEGTPLYYFGLEPPFGRTLGKHTLVTTIASLRDRLCDSLEEEDKLYMENGGSQLHYIGPMLGGDGMKRAATHKSAFTEEERKVLIAQSERAHRRRSELHPKKQEDLVGLVKNAKSKGRRIVMVCLGTVVTSDRAAFGWHGTGSGESITGKELVQSVINGVIDGLSPFSDQSIQSSVKADQTDSPLLICACGQQPDALDDIILPPNSIARASVPQVDILRCMDSTDLFVHHGGQNSTMEGGSCGIPMIVCPTFSDQPVNAAKLVKLKVALSIARPTTSGPLAVEAYRAEVAKSVSSIIDQQEEFAAAALELKREIARGGGEEAAEEIILQAIKDGV